MKQLSDMTVSDILSYWPIIIGLVSAITFGMSYKNKVDQSMVHISEVQEAIEVIKESTVTTHSMIGELQEANRQREKYSTKIIDNLDGRITRLEDH